MQIQFLGATGTVTGSKYLIEHGGRRLLVDCGLFQGLKQLRLRNWDHFPVPPASIDAVVLTHAHLDHSGFVPRLVTLGFKGPVHATPGTAALCGLLLPDSAHLMEEEAAYANRHGFSRHHPALPLYTLADAQQALGRFRTHGFGEPFEPIPGVQVRMSPAGHLLGAASLHVQAGGRSILFSGDLGRSDDLLMHPPAAPPACDHVVVESTYGNRTHARADAADQLAAVISRTCARGGIVVIPAFAVGRAQTLLHLIAGLKRQARIPDLPVYLNSPMAASATGIYRRLTGETRLCEAQWQELDGQVKVASTVEESRRLNELKWPSLIVSASGMATGGRVLHHLKAYAPDPRNTILFAGFQAAGTRGAALVGGAATVKIHGEHVPVRAEVVSLEAMSAHADRAGLLAWLGALPKPPQRVFVTHGEPEAADSLRQAVEERHGWATTVPEYRDTVDLQ
jgi:metallo-beta-lactamase family protein